MTNFNRGEIENILYNYALENEEEYPVQEILQKYTNKIWDKIKQLKSKIKKMDKIYIDLHTLNSDVLSKNEQYKEEIKKLKSNQVVIAEGLIKNLEHSQFFNTYTARLKDITYHDFVDDVDDDRQVKLILQIKE